MEINGLAHVILTAGDFEKSRAFYRRLLPFLGLLPLYDTEGIYYCIGGRTAVGVQRPSDENAGKREEAQPQPDHVSWSRSSARPRLEAR